VAPPADLVILGEIARAVYDTARRGFVVELVVVPEARRQELVDALGLGFEQMGFDPEALAALATGEAVGIMLGQIAVEVAEVPRLLVRARPRRSERDACEALPIEQIGERTAVVAIEPGEVVGFFKARLPDPVRDELLFATGHGDQITARMIPIVEEDGPSGGPTWVMLFESREVLDELRARMRERVGFDLFEMYADAH
jgi:hypothetical protein